MNGFIWPPLGRFRAGIGRLQCVGWEDSLSAFRIRHAAHSQSPYWRRPITKWARFVKATAFFQTIGWLQEIWPMSIFTGWPNVAWGKATWRQQIKSTPSWFENTRSQCAPWKLRLEWALCPREMKIGLGLSLYCYRLKAFFRKLGGKGSRRRSFRKAVCCWLKHCCNKVMRKPQWFGLSVCRARWNPGEIGAANCFRLVLR